MTTRWVLYRVGTHDTETGHRVYVAEPGEVYPDWSTDPASAKAFGSRDEAEAWGWYRFGGLVAAVEIEVAA